MKTWTEQAIIVTILVLILISICSSLFFGNNAKPNYEMEAWIGLLIGLYIASVVTKKEHKIEINIPKDAIKINSESSFGTVNVPTVWTEQANNGDHANAELTVYTGDIPKWDDVEVGQVSLEGEKVNQK